jgi:hypothetical protein
VVEAYYLAICKGMSVHHSFELSRHVDGQDISLRPIEDVDMEGFVVIGPNYEIVCIAFNQFGVAVGQLDRAASCHLEILDAVEFVKGQLLILSSVIDGGRALRYGSILLFRGRITVQQVHQGRCRRLDWLFEDSLDDEDNKLGVHSHQHVGNSVRARVHPDLLREVRQL